MSHERISTEVDDKRELIRQEAIEELKEVRGYLEDVQKVLEKFQKKMRNIELGDAFADDPNEVLESIKKTSDVKEELEGVVSELKNLILEKTEEDRETIH